MKLCAAFGFVLFFALSAFASASSVTCEINYSSIRDHANIHTVQVIIFPEDSGASFFTSIPIGRLTLEVGQGGAVTSIDGKTYPAVSVLIYGSNYLAPQAGDISPNPQTRAHAYYQSPDTLESVNVNCGLEWKLAF